MDLDKIFKLLRVIEFFLLISIQFELSIARLAANCMFSGRFILFICHGFFFNGNFSGLPGNVSMNS